MKNPGIDLQPKSYISFFLPQNSSSDQIAYGVQYILLESFCTKKNVVGTINASNGHFYNFFSSLNHVIWFLLVPPCSCYNVSDCDMKTRSCKRIPACDRKYFFREGENPYTGITQRYGLL